MPHLPHVIDRQDQHSPSAKTKLFHLFAILLLTAPITLQPFNVYQIEQVADINTIPTTYMATFPENLTAVGGDIFYTAIDDRYGRELWKSGSASGSDHLVRDIASGADYSDPGELTDLRGTLVFLANDGTHGRELWRSDGTLDGTRLVSDIAPGLQDAFRYGKRPDLTVLSNLIYFLADDGGGQAIWRSDGTAAGTTRVTNPALLPSGWAPLELAAAGDRLFVIASSTAAGAELWQIGSLPGGASQVADIAPGDSGSVPSLLTDVGDTIFFLADDRVHGAELWRSDGTPAGTQMVADLTPGIASTTIVEMAQLGGCLLFTTQNYSINGRLWVTDGTAAGTLPLWESPQGSGTTPHRLAAVGDLLYFMQHTAERGIALWQTDGTSSGTRLVADQITGPDGDPIGALVVHGSELFYTSQGATEGSVLWKASSAQSGITHVKVIDPAGASVLSALVSADASLYLVVSGMDLWRSDGTSAGTIPIQRRQDGTASSYPYDLIDMGGRLLFTADDGVHGLELWQSDGTPGGTQLVRDLLPGPETAYPRELARMGNTLFFAARRNEQGEDALWRSDGTAEGTTLVAALGRVRSIKASGDTLFVIDQSGLWVSDGTTGGTLRIKQLSNIWLSVATESGIAFMVESYGNDLWKSDGTLEGTLLIKRVADGPRATFSELTSANHLVFWVAAATSPLRPFAYDYRLWRSDGTPEGTTWLKLFNLPDSATGDPAISQLTPGVDTLFFVADDGVHGAELWITDGTTERTTLLKDVQPGSASSTPHSLLARDGTLWFVADDGVHGTELWGSDGTPARTALLKDIVPGPDGSGIAQLTPAPIDGAIVFSAIEDARLQLWTSDGTPSGTQRIRLLGGAAQALTLGRSSPELGRIFFIGNDGRTGFELWSLRIWRWQVTLPWVSNYNRSSRMVR